MKQQLDEIQILRAVAALAVLVFHTEREIAMLDPVGVIWFLRNAAWLGQFGVDIFFVISGFIMFYVHRTDFGHPKLIGQFFLRRVIRIVPSYWLLTAISVLGLILIPAAFNSRVLDWPWIVASFLFVPWTGPNGVVAPVVGPGWTLNYEMFFYLVFGALLAFPKRAALLTMAALLSGFAFLGVLLDPAAPVPALITSTLLLEFLLGVGISWLLFHGVFLPLRFRLGILVVSILILMIAIVVYRAGLLDTIWRLGFFGLPAAGIVVAVLLRSTTVDAAPRRGSLWRLLLAIGDSSYALYLTHVFTLRIGGLVLEGFLPQLPASMDFLVLTGLAILVGHLFFVMFDQPVYAWLKRRLPLHRPATVVP
ncbi:acyltransferase family protein [Mesorhizobium australicum]|uniref:Peptidoglycan/LPS O-acetylase OafA/YrhL, contains acyltransferase and SGNH-hydrolase domains n=1 Tax=Mesorhizobium australicum TaxID=536018 RepID=A0A1X7NSE2_9HYPH|nr:acyltransferase [Mesorhizobium australicum]SMH40668.1 Peptidoglycan/LPS O-acetylase OafA/YrhL, contains acyltransferase and SGNH-hydrolase domains [Mesorhizobium australicum]